MSMFNEHMLQSFLADRIDRFPELILNLRQFRQNIIDQHHAFLKINDNGDGPGPLELLLEIVRARMTQELTI